MDLLVQIQLGHPLVTDGLEEPLLVRLSALFPSSSHLSLTVLDLGLGLGGSFHIGRFDGRGQVGPLSDRVAGTQSISDTVHSKIRSRIDSRLTVDSRSPPADLQARPSSASPAPSSRQTKSVSSLPYP